MPTTRFPTALGDCAVTWDDQGLTSFSLPSAPALSPAPTPASVPPSSTPAHPPAIAALIARVQRHLRGDAQDFADLAYDWSCVTAFQQRVLRAVLGIAAGRTVTYGELGRSIGAKPGASRAIGGAVGANPWPLLIPCHRILGAGGKLTGYSGPGGVRTKARLLALEGVELPAAAQ